ncbi:g-D-glutamyl-meso-diaminopimelate peptidase, partial [Salirhabdus euzebyi]
MKYKLLYLLTLLFLLLPVTAINADSTVNPIQVYSYDRMTADIKNLAEKYPDLISYQSLGRTPYGREIWAVKLGKGDATVFFNASHHAREWITTNLVMEMIDQYSEAYKYNHTFEGYNVRKLLNESTIWFVPMVNPDGVTLQQSGVNAFPANERSKLINMNKGSLDFKRWKANAQGVDLNRQYPAGWTNREVTAPSYKNYPGTAPLTAPEAKTIAHFTYLIDPEISVAYHSSGRILYWYYRTLPSNYNRDLGLAQTISNITGYSLVKPDPNASGMGYTDWFIQEFKRPGFTPEVSYYVFETSPPLSVFHEEWIRNKSMGLYIASEGKKLWDAKVDISNFEITIFQSEILYDKPGEKHKTNITLSPGKYTVNAKSGSWYRIMTENGNKWITSKNAITGNYSVIDMSILLTEKTSVSNVPVPLGVTSELLEPQVVKAVKKWNDWYAIQTDSGEKWINPNNEILNFLPVKINEIIEIDHLKYSYSVPNVKNNQDEFIIDPGNYQGLYKWNDWVQIQTPDNQLWLRPDVKIPTIVGKSVHYNWGLGSPGPEIPSDDFSAEFDQSGIYKNGDYFIQTYADDGIKVEIDGETFIDRLTDFKGVTERALWLDVPEGHHEVKTKYFELVGRAAVFSDVVPFDSWLAYYYPNRTLSGMPTAAKVIEKENLHENFQAGSPFSGLPVDHFSARYTTAKRVESGEYILRARADDGIRVYVDGELVIDRWTNSGFREDSVKLTIKDRVNVPAGE